MRREYTHPSTTLYNPTEAFPIKIRISEITGSFPLSMYMPVLFTLKELPGLAPRGFTKIAHAHNVTFELHLYRGGLGKFMVCVCAQNVQTELKRGCTSQP